MIVVIHIIAIISMLCHIIIIVIFLVSIISRNQPGQHFSNLVKASQNAKIRGGGEAPKLPPMLFTMLSNYI